MRTSRSPLGATAALAIAVAAAVASLLVAGCSSSGREKAADPPPPTTAPAPSTSAVTAPPAGPVPSPVATSTTGVGRCATADLSLRPNGGSAATGHALAVFELRNTSSRTCRLLGYPGVRVLDSSGATLTDARRAAGFILSDVPAAAVTLAPGQVGYVGVESVNVCEGGGDPVRAASLQVTPPDETAALTAAASISVCPGAASVLVSPVRSSSNAITRH